MPMIVAICVGELELSGVDSELFELNDEQTELFLKAGIALDFELRSDSQTLVVNVSSALNSVATDTLRIMLIDVNERPVREGAIGTRMLLTGDQATSINLSDFFSDPDAGDNLSYTVRSANSSIVSVNVSGDMLALTPVAGSVDPVSVTVTATDMGGLNVTQTFAVSVNTRPAIEGAIGTQILSIGDQATSINLSDFFNDPDLGDSLRYTVGVGPTNASIVSAVVSGNMLNMLTLTPVSVSVDPVSVTVTAIDMRGLSIEQIFNVSVSTRPAIEGAIDAQMLVVGDQVTSINLSDFFSDPDAGDSLRYTVSSANSNIVSAAVSNNILALTPVSGSVDSVSVTVTATDMGGLSIEQTFTVTVLGPPSALMLSSLIVPSGEMGSVIGLLSATDDDGGDNPSFTWTLSDSERFEVVNDFLRLKQNIALSSDTEITVTATDAQNLESEPQAFTIRVLPVSEGQDNRSSGDTGVSALRATDPSGEVLRGLSGSDEIIGGEGDDIIDGGSEDDSLTGGGGTDVFVYRIDTSTTVVRDITPDDGIDNPVEVQLNNPLTWGYVDGQDDILDFEVGVDRLRFIDLNSNANTRIDSIEDFRVAYALDINANPPIVNANLTVQYDEVLAKEYINVITGSVVGPDGIAGGLSGLRIFLADDAVVDTRFHTDSNSIFGYGIFNSTDDFIIALGGERTLLFDQAVGDVQATAVGQVADSVPVTLALQGGAEDDVLIISDADFASIDGGLGIDTLRFDAPIALSGLENISSIENIDLANDGGNSNLSFTLSDVLAVSGQNTLMSPLHISGDDGDAVNLLDAPNSSIAGSWLMTNNGVTQDSYSYISAAGSDVLASVLIDDPIAVMIV